MRKILFGLLLLLGFAVQAQVYNNEWIDHTKTYYKFRVGKDGLFRISGATLSSAGMGSAAAQHFQLWRNGVQVPVYTSVASGTLSATDYIEFWGLMNDGKPDKELYREAGFQLNDKWSLITDSSTYFLTVNPAGPNLRLQTTANNVSGNTLPAEPFFIHTAGQYFKNKVNNGLFYIVGSDHLFSSSYDKGEGWTSLDIDRNATLTINNLTNLYAASAGPSPVFKINVSGNAYNSRRYKVTVNGDSVIGNPIPYMNQSEDQASFNLSLLSSGSASVGITNVTEDCGAATCPVDRMVAHKFEIVYPRLFNFGGEPNFPFSLAPSAAGNYLEISNFAQTGIPPVLYDLTNSKRYVGEFSGSLVRFVLEPSASARNLVLVSQEPSNISSITALQSRNFTNYGVASAQADYLIISNPLLFNGAGGANPVEEYRVYRASAQGGGYNAKIYLGDELIDQFGFGIKKNPAGIRNFIRFASHKFATEPKQVFIVGRGMHYLGQRSVDANGSSAQKDNAEKLNLVPSYGWPASDLLLAAEPGTSTAAIPIGRLTAITSAEVSVYLKKVKDLELRQQTQSPFIGDKMWMKNIAHIAGAGEEPLASLLIGYLNNYKGIIEDTLWGAKVSTFAKTSTNLVEQLNDADLTNLFNQGLSLVTYYGHSSATTLEFNLDEPANYNNPGKYPMFLALGCNAGNTFDYNENRFVSRNYLSDKYVLAPERGSINFIASSHFGIVHYLDIWNSRAYTNMAKHQYGATIGEIMKKTIDDVYGFTSADDFFARCNAEETILNGDPAVRLNQQSKPDYVITDTLVRISPSFVSVADQSFKVNATILNLGKVLDRRIVVEIKRQFPNQTIQILRRDTIQGVRFIDSINIVIPIDPINDKGTNKIIISVDQDNAVDELFETNNVVTKDIVIFEDEARPIYPNPFAIVNQSTITLKASTANPFSIVKQYKMEIDTTELFNSPLKTSSVVSSAGGLLEFSPGINFIHGTVYYWRVASVPANNIYKWNTSSFVYLNNSETGFNQLHLHQHLKSEAQRQFLDSASRIWTARPVLNNLLIKNGVWSIAAFQEADLIVSVNGSAFIRNTCNYGIIINVFDKNTFKPWRNQLVAGQGLYNSLPPNCGASRMYNFEFYNDTAGRRKAMEFLRNVVPADNYVVIRNQPHPTGQNQYVAQWQADEAIYGLNNSLYRELKNNGVNVIDSFYRLRTFGAVYKKGNNQFAVAEEASQSQFDIMSFTANCPSSDSLSYITSPSFGPAKQWKEARWEGTFEIEDNTKITILGLKTNGQTDTLFTNIDVSAGLLDISTANAALYPNLQMQLKNIDNTNFTPYQLKSWKLTYIPVPEGALAPNLLFNMKDTVEVGEPLEVKIGFKNISSSSFADSLKIKVIVTDRNNGQHILAVQKHKPVTPNELLAVQFNIDTRQLVGMNTMFLDINPDNDQPEQFHFNNFAFRNFYVRGDTLNPLLDVTFDNVHILNRDIVSSKPTIIIKLKDEAKWMLLTDPSIATVQVRYPDPSNGTVTSNSVTKTFNYNSDTLKFIPASGAPNANNSASIEFRPFFEEDGEYELVITGKDMSDNSAGDMSYRVGFQVINKAMISNMLNYPNPFTTSTAFVFTLTGSEVPQNIKIQILTVTGKIVREITKDELGPLHIGRNITEFKWDGTDQYGQKLANGVYLYRVVTNLNGKRLDKYTSDADNTDKYFNKGYGKMYLMR